MDVFCLPSQLEGNPVSAIEAQANGLPCFLSDTITRQAKILPQTTYLSIQDEAKTQWAKAITTMPAISRENGQKLLREAGIEVETAARKVEKKIFGIEMI